MAVFLAKLNMSVYVVRAPSYSPGVIKMMMMMMMMMMMKMMMMMMMMMIMTK